MSSRVFHSIAAISLFAALAASLALYWPGLAGPFLLDDLQNIVRVRVADFNAADLLYAATHNDSGLLGRPVSVLSLAFSGIVHGPGSWGYKYHNLLIHLLNGLLVFWLLLKLLPLLAARLPREKVAFIAGLAAAFWLLHPLMVSTVLYAVQRMAQLSALFTLAALLFYVSARLRLHARPLVFYSLAWLGFPLATLLACFSKENGALIPLYVLAIEMIAFGFRSEGPVGRRRLFLMLGLFVALPVLAGSLYVLTHLERLADYSLRDFTMGERLMTQLYVVTFYLKLTLLPRLADMNLFHDDMEVVRHFDLATFLLLLLFIAAAAAVFLLRRRAPVLAFAIAWFLISHLMESTFINLELAFEHRNYLAAVGPLLALVYYLCNIPGLPRLPYVSAAFLALLVFMTATRVQVWRSAPMLFQMAVIEQPRSYRANTEYANLSYNAGNVDLALRHLEIAQDINRKDFGSVIHEVVYRCGRGEDLAPHFEEARARASSHPASAYALNALDNLLSVYNQGRCPELTLGEPRRLVEAAASQEGIARNPRFRGYLERVLGHISILEGKFPEGERHLSNAYELTGKSVVLVELARIQLAFGRLDQARQVIARLERLNEASWGAESAKIEDLKTQLSGMEALRGRKTDEEA